MNYGLQHRYYARDLGAWSAPGHFPVGHAMGQVAAGCTDGMSNPVSCTDSSCFNGPCTVPLLPAPSGATTGSILLYQGTWQTFPALNVNTIISRVSQAVQNYGLQVTNSQNDGGVLTLGNFNVQLTLQVTGLGYAQPTDAGSMVDHAYYTVTGHMPVSSSTQMVSGPGGLAPSNLPAPAPAGGGTTTSMSSWMQSNAWWMVLAVAAAIALPRMIE